MKKIQWVCFGILTTLTCIGVYGFYQADQAANNCRIDLENKRMYDYSSDCGFVFMREVNLPLFITIMSLLFGWLPFSLSLCGKQSRQSVSRVTGN